MADADFGVERPEPLRMGHVAGTGRQSYWDAGPGWVAHYIDLLGDGDHPIENARRWIDGLLRTNLAPKGGSWIGIRMLDAATGSVLCELPRIPGSCTIAPDGRWIASAGDAVEVWSVPPPRQNLWATCAGLVVFGTVLAIGQRRSRRKPEPARPPNIASSAAR